MNFLFRFDQSRAVMFNRNCTRAMGNNEELQQLESGYAQRYPTRAWHFNNSYTHGEPDLKFEALQQSGCAFLKSLENFYDEALIAD